MRNRLLALTATLAALIIFSPALFAQTPGPSDAKNAKSPTSATMPDLSGIWTPRPDGIPINTWDSSDPFGKKPEMAPMVPWAAEKWKAARPPFGAKQTFQDLNDPVQRYCDPPGITRLYMYPYEMTIVQTPKMVYILYEFTRVFRTIALDQEHPKDPDPTWMGDSVGHYEGDTLVIDTIGFNDKTWLDHTGHPHSEALHVVERLRRVDPKMMELEVSVEDPKAYTKSFSGKKYFVATTAPMGEAICVYSEMDSFQKGVIDPATSSHSK